MHGLRSLVGPLLCLFLTVGCSTTRIVESWTAPGLRPADIHFQRVVAIAVVPKHSTQRRAEEALAAEIKGTKVIPAYTILSDEDRKDVDRLRAVLQKNGIDGAITVRLVNVGEKQTYVPGATRVYPGGYYGYYGAIGSVYHEPGYYRTDTYVVVETSLFDVAKGKLLWSGASKTMNPSGVDKVIAEIVQEARKDLQDKGLLP